MSSHTKEILLVLLLAITIPTAGVVLVEIIDFNFIWSYRIITAVFSVATIFVFIWLLVAITADFKN